jgi:hypothetical protein
MSTSKMFFAMVSVIGLAGCFSPAAPEIGQAEEALTTEQCTYFAQDSKVTICHRTSSAKNPYNIIKVNIASCGGHSGHNGDYIAYDDPTCNGQGCFPEGAPFDGSVECCDGLAPVNGYCANVDECATNNGGCGEGFACQDNAVVGQPPTCTNIDDCASAPCQNGDCSDGVNSYSCSCDAGYEGTNCDINTDDCAGSPCQNGGACLDGLGSYACECAEGFEGVNCEIEIPTADATGCSDGTREGFTDAEQYPQIAACSGGWSIPGVRTPSTVDPACDHNSGNDSSNPNGVGCNVADLCEEGWHVCNNASEVAVKTSGNGCTDASLDNSFFVQREASFGFYSCVDTGDLNTAQNDMWGCAGTSPLMSGLFTAKPCGVLNATVGDTAAGLTAPWSAAGNNSFNESAVVTKSGPDNGGVLCCAD